MSDLPPGWRRRVRRWLAEDVGRGDRTTEAIIPEDLRAEARIVTRQPIRVAGIEPALEAFRALDGEVRAEVLVPDGCDAGSAATLARVGGPARALLTGERTALNILGRLSGIATATARAVAAARGHRARITDTRKTTPGLRAFEKYAVRMGGGVNHRFGLDDGILIKDNHVAAAGGIAPAVGRARAAGPHLLRIEVECETHAQVEEALAAGADAILLDNMAPADIAEAVRLVAGRALVEASGGITPDRVAEVAATGVDLISLGWLTHSAPAADVSLELD